MAILLHAGLAIFFCSFIYYIRLSTILNIELVIFFHLDICLHKTNI